VAVPARPGTKFVRQPDGRMFEVRQRGDEWLHWTETTMGIPVALDPASGYWKYVQPLGRTLGPLSNRVVGKDAPPMGPWKPVLSPRGVARRQTSRAPRRAVPSFGTNNVITILITFKDTTSTFTEAQFESALFGTAGKTMRT